MSETCGSGSVPVEDFISVRSSQYKQMKTGLAGSFRKERLAELVLLTADKVHFSERITFLQHHTLEDTAKSQCAFWIYNIMFYASRRGQTKYHVESRGSSLPSLAQKKRCAQ